MTISDVELMRWLEAVFWPMVRIGGVLATAPVLGARACVGANCRRIVVRGPRDDTRAKKLEDTRRWRRRVDLCVGF